MGIINNINENHENKVNTETSDNNYDKSTEKSTKF